MSSSSLPPQSPWPIFTTIADYKAWRWTIRRQALAQGMHNGNGSGSSSSSSVQHHDAPSVGFVPTMGALHAGHLDLVQRSLRENAYTVISIFVNPAQFAPNEDLASYPRTLPSDVQALIEAEQAQGQKGLGTIGALFVPNVQEMYPPLPGTSTPFTQNVQQQEGAFVTMHGSLSSSLEGASRPAFFRGVATVVTKLFHAVEPTRVYFGQKDIQQALILRGMVSSLLFGAPGNEGFKVVETRRDNETGLALSSRNAYLSDEARRCWAPLLIRGLEEGRSAFDTAIAAGEAPAEVERKVTSTALHRIDDLAKQAKQESGGRVRFEVDYISLNCRYTLRPYAEAVAAEGPAAADGAVLSGAVALIEQQGEAREARRTRLIDNLLLGKAEEEILGASSER